MLRPSFLLPLAWCVCCSSAAAHNTWLAPESPTDARKYWALMLSTGHAFPQQDEAPSERMVARADLLSSRRSVALFPLKATQGALPFRVVSDDDPVQVAVVALKPGDVTLTPEAVAVYLREELGDDAAVRERFVTLGRWRERFTKNAKALLRLHGDAPAAVAMQPHGLAYELVPSVDPTLLPGGTPFEVCAYADDRRVRRDDVRIQIGLIDANGHASTQPGNADGCATVAPATAGGYLLHSILLRPVERDDVDWESHFAALTVVRAVAPLP